MKTAALLAALAGLLHAAAPRQLSIVKTAFHQYDGGPAVAGSFSYLAGETVFFSFQVAGFQANEDGKISLTWSAEAADPQGLKLAPPLQDKVVEELAAEDKAWLPKVRTSFQTPPTGPSGTYRISVRARDELSGSEAKFETNFEVRGRNVEPSSDLAIRNFRYLKSEDDREPLPAGVYKQGEAVWARFEITGHKFGDRNRIDVRYGVSFLKTGGEVLYSEPNAAADKDESFYPKRWVEGILSLKLDADIAKGEYAIVVAAADGVGGQKTEGRYPLKVE